MAEFGECCAQDKKDRQDDQMEEAAAIGRFDDPSAVEIGADHAASPTALLVRGVRQIRHCTAKKKARLRGLFGWSEWSDSNTRPPRPERGALPDCATLRDQRRLYRPAHPVAQAPKFKSRRIFSETSDGDKAHIFRNKKPHSRQILQLRRQADFLLPGSTLKRSAGQAETVADQRFPPSNARQLQGR